MTKQEMTTLLRSVKINENTITALENAYDLGVEFEREAIARIIEDAPALVEHAKNENGGCLVCGWTPKRAVVYIRERGQS